MFKRADTEALLNDLDQLVKDVEKSGATTRTMIDCLKQILLKHLF